MGDPDALPLLGRDPWVIALARRIGEPASRLIQRPQYARKYLRKNHFTLMTVDYVACREALERAHATLDASECHGVLCGLLCVTRQFPEERWLNEILEPGGAAGPESARCTKMLRSTRRETERQLEDQQFEFEPMLPHDEVSLTRRGEALARWCRGFLYGLAVGGLDDSVSTSEDVREVLNDLSDFTRLDVSELEDASDALESDYAELVEYVRVGVMLIHTELKSRHDAPPGPGQLH